MLKRKPASSCTSTVFRSNNNAESHAEPVSRPLPLPFPSPIGTPPTRSSSLEALFGIQLRFDHLYELTDKLRSGSFATVWVGRHSLTKEEFAVKVVDRRKLKPKDDRAVFREVAILRALCGYSRVINLIDFFELPDTFYVILELARGGDVFDRLSRRTVYTEQDARHLAQNLLQGVQYIHSVGIVHRDLKPENLLLVDETDDSNIKIADFGFAKLWKEAPTSAGLTTRCGTPAFVAPEILIGVPYGKSCDMWSCGVILYLLLGGYPPFQHENHKGLFRKIRAADYVFHDKYWDGISTEAKQLIAALLTVDPSVRMTADQALNSSWMTLSGERGNLLSNTDLSESLNELRKFNGRRKLKGAMHAVAWAVDTSFWNADAVTFMDRTTTSLAFRSGLGTGVVSPATPGPIRKLTNGKVGKTFRDMYELTERIRTGSFATVWKGIQRETGTPHAIKVIKRADLKPKDDAQVMNEVAILQSLRHEHIVPLTDFFEERDYFFMVMELMDGGDVFDRIVERNHYTEKDARNLARALLEAVAYMHSRGVAHRDLKPQNLLLARREDDSYIKVADFGFSKRVHTPQSLMTRCGTPTYVAPEILKNHPHDEAADNWSVGVIIYVLLVGYPPFMEDNQKVLFRKIRMGDYEFYAEDWENVSGEAQDIIRQLLVVEPSQRMTAADALKHAWFHNDGEECNGKKFE